MLFSCFSRLKSRCVVYCESCVKVNKDVGSQCVFFGAEALDSVGSVLCDVLSIVVFGGSVDVYICLQGVFFGIFLIQKVLLRIMKAVIGTAQHRQFIEYHF